MFSRFWALVAIILLADQATKFIVMQQFERGVSLTVVDGVLSLTYVMNPGGAFGVLGSSDVLLLLVTSVTVALILVGHRYLVRSGLGLPVALLLGGAAGNLLDRIRYGAVVDFIDFGFWPVFNVADIAIVAGVGLLVLSILRRDRVGW